MKRIREFIQWLNRNYNPFHLRREITILEKMVISRDAIIDEYEKQPGEATARAMLMQLRVHQESVRRRTGYMVSAFIPLGVVEQLIHLGSDQQRCFVQAVAEVLVNNAVNGIYKRSQATNKLTALIFEPISKHGQNVALVGGIFETDEKPPEFVRLTNKEKLDVLLPVTVSMSRRRLNESNKPT